MGVATLTSWREGLDAGDLSAEALVHASMERMAALEGRLGAILRSNTEEALRLARQADRRLRAGERTPMLGIPVVLKDNLAWKGQPLTHGSRISEGYVAPYDATVVARLLAAGAIPVAQAAMDEFAMGSSGEYCAFGPTRNPWDPSRVPGGSSSGSVVSVAAGYVPFALGSDTGGSVRLPAAFCGVTGFRPTYGVLSRYGLSAMASSLDQVGPVARDAADLMRGLSVMVGRDPLDSTSCDLPGAGRLGSPRPHELKGLRIGLPEECFGEGLAEGVRSRIQEALAALAGQGAELVPVRLPHASHAIDTYYLLNTAEVSSNLSRFDGVRFGARKPGEDLQDLIARTREAGFGAEVKRRILLGAFCLSRGHYEAFYLRAQKVRTLLVRDFEAAFASVDLLAMPVSPDVAFPLGAKVQDPLAMYLADIFTVTASLAGLPCISLPAGLSEGLPVGLQLVGAAMDDVRLLEASVAFQRVTEHHREAP